MKRKTTMTLLDMGSQKDKVRGKNSHQVLDQRD